MPRILVLMGMPHAASRWQSCIDNNPYAFENKFIVSVAFGTSQHFEETETFNCSITEFMMRIDNISAVILKSEGEMEQPWCHLTERLSCGCRYKNILQCF